MSSASNPMRKLEAVSNVAPPPIPPAPAAPPRAKRLRQSPERLCRVLTLLGLGFLVPPIRMACGEEPRGQLKALWRILGVPVVAVVLFGLMWSFFAARVHTSLGQIPGPAAVWQQAGALWADHKAERERETQFYQRQVARNAERLKEDPAATVSAAKYTGRPTYIDQILTSLKTVFTGFLFATLLAVPIGILCGMSRIIEAAINPFVQLFKPISPLAWLPIVTLVVSAVYVSDNPVFEKSFLVSSITVALCSLWPTVINTALGVSSVDKDLLNVAKVLRLDWKTRLFKLVLPSSLPLIFTGMRLSLNPGLGKFVWDEFQNGSPESMSRMLVAVITIGFIGFLLDRVMQTLQSLTDFGARR
jgi:nitrate/nitrite transport system permease protein